MSIWHKSLKLDKINEFNKNTLMETLDITVVSSDDNSISATMPINSRVHQPFGVLHGGASCVLAESIASIAANNVVDFEKFYAVGLDINANHLRPVKRGVVTAKANAIHLGSKTHVWNIEIRNQDEKLVCISRMTMAILPR